MLFNTSLKSMLRQYVSGYFLSPFHIEHLTAPKTHFKSKLGSLKKVLLNTDSVVTRCFCWLSLPVFLAWPCSLHTVVFLWTLQIPAWYWHQSIGILMVSKSLEHLKGGGENASCILSMACLLRCQGLAVLHRILIKLIFWLLTVIFFLLPSTPLELHRIKCDSVAILAKRQSRRIIMLCLDDESFVLTNSFISGAVFFPRCFLSPPCQYIFGGLALSPHQASLGRSEVIRLGSHCSPCLRQKWNEATWHIGAGLAQSGPLGNALAWCKYFNHKEYQDL